MSSILYSGYVKEIVQGLGLVAGWSYEPEFEWAETKISGFKDAELIKAEAVNCVSIWKG